MLTDTILAISSPPASPGAGGIRGILRISGEGAWPLARAVTSLGEAAGVGWHGGLRMPVGEAFLDAAVLLFQGPRSFTGQDIAELHLPNSPALLQYMFESLRTAAARLKLPVRIAQPGEFTARAFFNGKVDLTQAEGIAATISAANQSQLRAAASLREGDLHKELTQLTERLADLLAQIEAGIDFSDEEGVSFVKAEKAFSLLDQLSRHIEMLLTNSVRADRLDALPTVVFIGKPNVGKSSLINALSGSDRSIVSPVAGTTRDQLAVIMLTPQGAIQLIDVAGDEVASDELRGKMIDARRRALLEADLVIRVIDHTEDARAAHAEAMSVPAEFLLIQNKCDLLPQRDPGNDAPPDFPALQTSARTGQNLGQLREMIVRYASRRESISKGRIALNQRHRVILQDAKSTLWRAARHCADDDRFRGQPELLAAELRHALDLLGQITGTISPDEVLGRIFSTFCIGK